MLDTTHPNKALVRRMGNSTDLGENTPSQLSWEPALRGRSWEGFYLLFKTYFDTSPDVRGGRVFSHTFIIEQQHLSLLTDLRPLLATLPPQLSKGITINPIEIETLPADPPTLTPRLGYLLKELVKPTRSGPVIWAGQTDFEDAANQLWQTLNAEERWELTLNFGFLPNQLRDPAHTMQLVAVPNPMLQRWRGDFFVIESDAAHIDLSEAEAYVAGDFTRAPNLSLLIKVLGTAPRQVSDLDKLQRMAPTAVDLANATLPEVLTLAAALHWYSPAKPDLGRRTISRLAQLIEASEAEDLGRLGSLTKANLAEKELTQIAVAASKRTVELSLKPAHRALAGLLVEWADEPARSWWRQSLRSAVQAIFDNWSRQAGQLVLDLWEQPTEAVADYLQLLPATKRVEEALINELPNDMSGAAWKRGIALARSRKWFRLHMGCLLKLVNLPEALQRQLVVDTEPGYSAALRLASERVAAKEFVAAAVTLADNRLVEIAGELCAKQPKLLHRLDISTGGWQAVWLASYSGGGSLWAGIEHPANTVTGLLKHLVAGGSVNEELLALISTSEYADVRAYPVRADLWKALSVLAKSNFLDATAMGIVIHEKPEDSSKQFESELAAVFSNPTFVAKALLAPGMTLGRAVIYIERFAATESLLVDYLDSYRGKAPTEEAIALGQLVRRKHWDTAAQKIFGMSWLNDTFKAALAYCLDLLGPLDKFKSYFSLGLSASSSKQSISDNWWHSLLEELKNVYYGGPLQDGLWEESGGENHVIKSGRSGGEQWSDALRKMRGHRVRNKIDTLMSVLTRHQPHNEIFRILQQTLPNA